MNAPSANGFGLSDSSGGGAVGNGTNNGSETVFVTSIEYFDGSVPSYTTTGNTVPSNARRMAMVEGE